MNPLPTVKARLVPLPALVYEPLVRAALLEDFGIAGDVTSDVLADGNATAALISRETGVLAGLDPALFAFRLLDGDLRIDRAKSDGNFVSARQTIAVLRGTARAVLGAERTALNLLSHLSGIATETARYVEAVAGTNCTICETRKTLPGLRALQKYAVRAGGGRNHRLRADDAILIKDNHIAIAGGVAPALRAARARAGHLMKIEIEVDSLWQLDDVLRCGGADAVLLDNFSLEDLQTAVRRVNRTLTVEASGGITLQNVAEVAQTGVDVISVGALTHSVRALDIALDVA